MDHPVVCHVRAHLSAGAAARGLAPVAQSRLPPAPVAQSLLAWPRRSLTSTEPGARSLPRTPHHRPSHHSLPASHPRPFWQALVSPHATSYLAPVALWLYMLMVQLGLLNLLIAIMTDTYFKVRRTSPAAHAPFTPAPEHDPSASPSPSP